MQIGLKLLVMTLHNSENKECNQDKIDSFVSTKAIKIMHDSQLKTRMTAYIPGVKNRIRSDPLIFGLPEPDQDPTCNNGYIKLFLSNKI